MERRRKKTPQLPCITTIPQELWPILDEYLTRVMASAKTAEASSRKGARIDPTGCFAANALYWKHAYGGFRWLRGQIRRQIQEAYERESKSTRTDGGGAGGGGR